MANELYAKNGIVIRGATSTLLIDSSGDSSPQANIEPYQKALIIADAPNVQYNPENLGSVSPTLSLFYSGAGFNTEGVIGPAIAFVSADDNNSGGHSSVIRTVKSDTGIIGQPQDGSLLVIGTREADGGGGAAVVKEGIRLGHNQYTGLHYKPDSSTNPPAMLTIGTTASEDITIGVRQTTATINAITNYGQFYVKNADGLPYFKTGAGTEYNLTEGSGGSTAHIGNANLSIPDANYRTLTLGNLSTFCIEDASGARFKVDSDKSIKYNNTGATSTTMWQHYIGTDNDNQYAGFKIGDVSGEFEIKLSGEDRHFVWTAATSSSATNDLMRLDSISSGKSKLTVYGQIASALPATNTVTGSTASINWDNGNGQVVDLQGTPTTISINLSAPVEGATYFVKLIQGSQTVTTINWNPASILHDVVWPGGVAPTPTTTNNAIDTVVFFFDGTDYYGNFAQNYS